MSHVAYDLQLADAMNDLQEQVKVEHVPAEKNEAGVENIETWQPDEAFQHLAFVPGLSLTQTVSLTLYTVTKIIRIHLWRHSH